MGEYLSLFTQIKESIYGGRTEAARDMLKKLLNSLNFDYAEAKSAAEREKVKGAIVRLLPALDDLKKGIVSENAIRALSLNRSRLPVLGAPLTPPPPIPPRPVNPTAYAPPRSAAANPDPSRGSQNPAPSVSSVPPAAADKGAKGKGRKGNVLRPLTLDDYVGQEKAKKSLRISIGAAKKTGGTLAHLLICSPYGLGKTTLANIIANETGLPFFSVNATNLKDVKALSLYFSKIEQSCIVFIDEIHTLKKDVQTVLLSIMTDFAVSFIDESGEEQRFELPPFTLIGATTQAGELLKPFLNRFAVLELEDYTEEEKSVLVRSKLAKLGYEGTEEAVAEIARRCRGIPRTIETYVKGVIDVALMRDEKTVTAETAGIYFGIHEIDGLGLTKNDLRILHILDESEKPLALVTLESRSGIQKEDLELRYEPYLIRLGLIDKTERGRVITRKGREYLRPDGDGTDDPDDPGDPDLNDSDSDGAENREDNAPDGN